MKSKTYKSRLLTLFVRCYNAAKGILFADKYILNVISSRSKPNVVNLHYWNSSLEIGDECKNNLGDDLSEVIVSSVLAKKGLSLDTRVRKKKHLYAVGSIVSMGYQSATIWGSGFLEDLSWIRRLVHRSPFRKLDIRAVRGPLTRELLLKLGHECPEVYGDPGILLPYVYSPSDVQKEEEYIIIPHFTKDKEYRERYGEDHIVSMITKDYKQVIDRICSAKKVISSSLHGIILAETYGTPAVFLKDRGDNKDFKYLDYYSSTLRPNYKYAKSVEEAINMEPMFLPSNINELREKLLEAFPYDLWNN